MEALKVQNKNFSPADAEPKLKQATDFNTLSAQRSRILAHLRMYRKISTSEAREDLNIMHPAGRISELRKLGFEIKCKLKIFMDSFGVRHRMGVYELIAEPANIRRVGHE
jgi:hypothetical protein